MFRIFHKNGQVSATIFTLMLHVALVVCMVMSGEGSSSILPQSLQVSLVAPSISAKFSNKAEIKTPVNNTISKNSVIKKAESTEKNTKNNGEGDRERITSGQENANANAISSAVSEPVFNAAYLNNPAPIYPSSAKRDNIQGKVLLLVEVSSDGFAKSTKIAETSGYALLDNAAKAAVSSWKFIPAKHYGKFVEAQVLIPIEFKLT